MLGHVAVHPVKVPGNVVAVVLLHRPRVRPQRLSYQSHHHYTNLLTRELAPLHAEPRGAQLDFPKWIIVDQRVSLELLPISRVFWRAWTLSGRRGGGSCVKQTEDGSREVGAAQVAPIYGCA